MIARILLLLASAFILSCSTMRQPGFGERDSYVVNTPEYPDNRVFYLGKLDRTTFSSTLLNQFSVDRKRSENDPAHGQPLTIVLNSASLPIKNDAPSKLPFVRARNTRDIAVMLDIAADNQAQSQTIVAWYQRGVYPGQTLNFSNLLIYHQDSWDESVPPLIRIRVMDVAAEANLETRETLSEVSKYSGSIALALQNPSLSPIVDTAAKAASLILTNRQNRMLLDYSIQFYKSETPEESPLGESSLGLSHLTPLKTGRFLLIGRRAEALSDRSYWRAKYVLDETNGDVTDLGGTPINTPVVVMTVNKTDVIVPQFIAAKSAYLSRLLSDTSNKNLDLIAQESDELRDRVKLYVLKEHVRRFRTRADLDNLVTYIEGEDHGNLPGDAMASVIRMLVRISKCPGLTTENLSNWWSANSNSTAFSPDDFELIRVDCSTTEEVIE